ncbi:MAG: hypothetical protein PWP49_139 [Thermococcaceae archaeon]|jgi:hypothetical protein|uniref:bifunctional DNA primase/polymerase n=1 Tax=Thermococcus sp. PK TaxID=913025 RepID=UPI0005B2E3BB|nr:bifunctional DNA primase/polymerase [Thermococcus sp. PK]MDK2853189.1 hypothetical protein [Thermococcaceae archaeon]MDN5319719.1 hypothetical protein [Thermococcaceae archaeon]HIH73365.1 bifunctional DNA primase/polymerase [Thermococcaceae archaeon]
MASVQEKLALIEQYSKLGWKVIPLKPGEKRPYWADWANPEKWGSEEYSNERTIQELKKTPQLNVGVLAGEVSGIIAIDVDQPKIAGYNSKKAIELGALAHTTSKAPRLIFRSSNPEVLNFSKKVVLRKSDVDPGLLVPGTEDKAEVTVVEILGTGRQFVVPPSIHPSGTPYEWVSHLPEDPNKNP